mgnify:FL=1
MLFSISKVFLSIHALYRCFCVGAGLVINKSLKALSPCSERKLNMRSGNERLLRSSGNFDKVRQARTAMHRITKLKHRDFFKLIGVRYQPSVLWVVFRIYRDSLITKASRGELTLSNLLDSMQRAKAVYRGVNGTMGNPKILKSYGFGVSVLGVNQRETGIRFYSQKFVINGSKKEACEKLVEHRVRNNIDKKNFNKGLIHLVSDISVLKLAYELIKSNFDQTTHMSLNWFKLISVELKSGKYVFLSDESIYSSKKVFAARRSFVRGSLRDIIVQKALQLVLEPVFEPHFLDSSHGFRPKRGCHTALKTIKRQFNKSTWVIKFDVSQCFDIVDHKLLLELISRRVSCIKTITLVKRLIQSGLVDFGVFSNTKLGSTRKSLLSPLLCNIYLHELDSFMYKLKKKFSFSVICHCITNPKDWKLLDDVSTSSDDSLLRVNFKKEQKFLFKKDKRGSCFRRFFYLRYGDHFVIGVTGSQMNVQIIKYQVQEFLKVKFNIYNSQNKSMIINFKKSSVFFLGTTIYSVFRKKKLFRSVRYQRLKSPVRLRVKSCLVMHAPIEQILEKLQKNGFIKRNYKGIYNPTALYRLVNLKHADIISYYNSVSREFLNFYSFVDNYSRLGVIIKYHLRGSCALTLALKYKLRYKSKVFARFGSRLKCPYSGVEFQLPKSFKRTNQFKTNLSSIDLTMLRQWDDK